VTFKTPGTFEAERKKRDNWTCGQVQAPGPRPLLDETIRSEETCRWDVKKLWLVYFIWPRSWAFGLRVSTS